MPERIVLVCGDRNWDDYPFLSRKLTLLHRAEPITVVVEGEANGADKMGARWARRNAVAVDAYHARWELEGKAAGPIRNQRMLDEGHPGLIIAFHDAIEQSRGTKDMVNRALRSGLSVIVYSHTGTTYLSGRAQQYA